MSSKNAERAYYIEFICKMLERMDMRRIGLVYELVLGMTSPNDEQPTQKAERRCKHVEP